MKALRVVIVALAVIGAQRVVSSQSPADRPSLVFSTYWGGSQSDQAVATAVDAEGNLYVAGTTASADFPRTVNTLPALGGSELFVSKFDAAGTLIFSTVVGGSSTDTARGIAIDSAGNIIVVGDTFSPDLPVVNPIQPSFHMAFCGEFGGICSDGFALKIDATGHTLLFSTYLGTNTHDAALDVAVDSADNMYIVGAAESTFDGVTPIRAFSGGREAFVAKIPPAGGVFSYFTYLGGSFTDSGNGIAVDPSGNAYVTGVTGSQNFPVLNPIQPTPENFSDSAFVTKLDPSGNIAYSTFLSGAASDAGLDIAVDAAGRAHVVGLTASTNFPVKNPWQPFLRGFNDLFVSVLSPAGTSLEFSTYLGGSDREQGQSVPDLTPAFGVALDAAGNTYVTGLTQSSDFPVTYALQPFGGGLCLVFPSLQMRPCPDAFVTKLDPRGRLLFSTPMGGSRDDRGRGIAVTPDGMVYVVGNTTSTNFPVKAALKPSLSGTSDGVIAKISTAPLTCQLPAPAPIAPVGGIFDPRPTFSWQPVAGADAYIVVAVDVAQSLLTGTPPTQLLGITTGSSLTPAAPLAAGDYEWTPVAVNQSCGLGRIGTGATFTLPGSCPTPQAVPISPIGGGTVNNPISLNWSVGGPSIASLSLALVFTAETGRFVGQYAVSGTTVTIPTTLATGNYAWVAVTWNSTCGASISSPAFFRSSGSVGP
jgi:hypothetical protein